MSRKAILLAGCALLPVAIAGMAWKRNLEPGVEGASAPYGSASKLSERLADRRPFADRAQRRSMTMEEENAARQVMIQLLAALEDHREKPDEKLRATAEALLEKSRPLTTAQLGFIAAGVMEAEAPEARLRHIATEVLIRMLSGPDSQLSISLFEEMKAHFGESPGDAMLLENLLHECSMREPELFMDYLSAYRASFPGENWEWWGLPPVGILAEKNPAEALEKVKHLRGEQLKLAVRAAAHTQQNPAGRTALWEAARRISQQMDTPEIARDFRESALIGIARGLSGIHVAGNRLTVSDHGIEDDFEANHAWVEAADFSPEERRIIDENLNAGVGAESGQWLDWLAERATPELMATKTVDFMGSWMSADLEGAEQWVAARPEGPLKEAAVTEMIRIHLEKSGPEEARRAARLLPEGPTREQMLHRIEVAADD